MGLVLNVERFVNDAKTTTVDLTTVILLSSKVRATHLEQKADMHTQHSINELVRLAGVVRVQNLFERAVKRLNKQTIQNWGNVNGRNQQNNIRSAGRTVLSNQLVANVGANRLLFISSATQTQTG